MIGEVSEDPASTTADINANLHLLGDIENPVRYPVSHLLLQEVKLLNVTPGSRSFLLEKFGLPVKNFALEGSDAEPGDTSYC